MSLQSSTAGNEDYRRRVAKTRAGIPVTEAKKLMDAWGIPVGRFATILGSSERKWARLRSDSPKALLGPVESDRLLRLRAVLDHAAQIFDSVNDAKTWFSLPNHALSEDTPLSLMDTDAGVREVDDVLTRLEFGVFG